MTVLVLSAVRVLVVSVLSSSVLALALSACTGGRTRSSSAVPPVTVLPSADRIRLGQTRLGGPPSCLDDAYCAPGLSRVYGIGLGTGAVALTTTVSTVEALRAGAIDVGAIPSWAPATSDPGIVGLSDDRGLTPANNIVPVVRGPVARNAGAALSGALDEVSAQLSPAGLTVVERALDSGTPPDLAARAWMASHVVAGPTPPPGAPTIKFGAQDDDESRALATLYAGALARDGWSTVVVRLDGGRADALDALDSGRVDVVPEHLAGLVDYLSGFTASATSDVGRTLALLRTELADLELVAMTPAVAGDGTTFTVSRAVASALGLQTLSDLARATGAHTPSTTSTAVEHSSTTSTVAPGLSGTDAPGSSTTLATLGAPATLGGEAPAEPASSGPTLGIGSRGAAVVGLQQRLTELGYYRSYASGLFDQATRRAVVAFQGDQLLITDGALDAPTRRALRTARPAPHPSTAPTTGDPGSVRVPASIGGPNVILPGSALGTVYLAFAGGPSPVTAQVLDLLHRHQATATFFVDAGALARSPDIVRLATQAGNTIGTSAPPHDAFDPISLDLLMRTVTRTQDALGAIVPQTPQCVLAPYGATDPATRQRAAQLGHKVVLWDVDPQDWRRPGADVISEDTLGAVHAGSVVLLHDGGGDRTQTVVALATILDRLAQRGYGVAAIPDCAG